MVIIFGTFQFNCNFTVRKCMSVVDGYHVSHEQFGNDYNKWKVAFILGTNFRVQLFITSHIKFCNFTLRK